MKTLQDWLWKLLLGVVIIFFARQVLSTAVTFLALASPPVANLAFCPLDRVGRINPDPFKSSAQGFGIICYDQSGSAMVIFSYTDIWTLERDYFHTASYTVVTLLVVAWYLRPFIRQRIKSKSNSA